MQLENPKVFVSHASEDKDGFVLGFATKLYFEGIAAWVDKWEMLVSRLDRGWGDAGWCRRLNL